jgi:hypothetical protein
MATRLERRNNTYTQWEINKSHGLFDLLDMTIKEMCRITEEELQYYNDIANNEELDLVTSETLTYKQKRELITFLTTKIYIK